MGLDEEEAELEDGRDQWEVWFEVRVGVSWWFHCFRNAEKERHGKESRKIDGDLAEEGRVWESESLLRYEDEIQDKRD